MADVDEEEFSTSLISSLYKPPALLPIAQLKESLLYTIETYPVTIIVSKQVEAGLSHSVWLTKKRSVKQAAEKRRKYRSSSTVPGGRMMAPRSP